MCDEKTIKKINEGKAFVLTRSSAFWGIGVTLIIFIITNLTLAGVWKGNVDEKINNRPTFEQTRQIVKDEVREMKDDIKTIKEDVKEMLKQK